MAVCATQRVVTRRGPEPVKNVAGDEPVELWNGEEFAPSRATRVTKPLKMLEIALSDGTVVRCTPDRMFHVPALSGSGFRKPVAASRLHRGLRLARERFPVTDPDAQLPNAYEQGVYSVSGREGEGFKSLACKNAAVADRFEADVGDEVDVTDIVRFPRCHVPTLAGLESKRQWLSGLFDALEVRPAPGTPLTLSFRDQGFMKEVQVLLLTCGIRCHMKCRPNDLAAITFPADDTGRVLRLLGRGADPPPGRAGLPGFRLLARAPLEERAKKAGHPVFVRSVRKLQRPREAYLISGATVV